MGQTRHLGLFYFLPIIIIIVGVSVNFYRNLCHKNELLSVIHSMEHIEIVYDQTRKPYRSPKIAIGFGGCTDHFSRAIACFKHLKMSGPTVDPVANTDGRHRDLNSLDDINREFSQFFIEGAAAEYVFAISCVNNSDLIDNDTLRDAIAGNNPMRYE